MQSTSFKTREDQNKLNILLLMVCKISVWNSILVVLCNISNCRKQFLMELLFLTESESLCFGTLCDPMDYTVHGILQAKIQKWVPFSFSRGSSQPRTPSLQVSSLLAEPQGKSKNTGVGSLSLLQGIFLTQESDQGFLHCRRILYQLSYEGSPF